MSNQPSLWDTTSATSLPGSAAGASLSDSQDGPMTDPSGPAPVRASRSQARARTVAPTIRATFGRRGFASSASAALQQSLVSRLKRRLPTGGSTLFRMTWNEKATPSGRSACLLRASGHRTSANGCGSWPSPRVSDEAASRTLDANGNRTNKAGSLTFGANLSDKAQLASWPTPTQQDQSSSGARDYPPTATHHAGTTLTDAARMTAWATPRAEDSESTGAHRGTPDTLTSQSRLSSWATPTSRDHKDGSSEGTAPENALLGRQVWQARGPILSGSPAETAKPGQLNPAFSRWLMGYPPAWDDCAATATPSSRRSRRK